MGIHRCKQLDDMHPRHHKMPYNRYIRRQARKEKNRGIIHLSDRGTDHKRTAPNSIGISRQHRPAERAMFQAEPDELIGSIQRAISGILKGMNRASVPDNR
jgi:hypothetical protein